MDNRLILVTLLVRLGVAAAVAGGLARSRYFKYLLFKEERTTQQKIQLALYMSVVFALGVGVRILVKNFLAADLAFECCILIGVMVGRTGGVVGALLVSMGALANGEWMALPFNLLAALVGGEMREYARNKEDIWAFSPLFDLSIYRWIKRFFHHPRLEWQPVFAAVILALQALHVELGRYYPTRVFVLDDPRWGVRLAVYFTTVMVVAIPLKIWTSTRFELKLEEQQSLLLQARMEALQSQINPHFLFNTLNTVSSLTRIDPEKAREVIVKLASILRRLLNQQQSFVLLREELEFIDDYLEIEQVRFGDKLRIVKELHPETLEAYVPSMILQPLIENSIKHGFAQQLEGGTICIRSRVDDEKLVLQVEDDGVGMEASESAADDGRPKVGMANVAERLRVLYPNTAWMSVAARPGGGTVIALHLPYFLLTSDLEPAWVDSVIHEERSRTRR